MKKISIIIIMGLALVPSFLYAQKEQGEFSMSAQLRTRGEYRNGALYPRSKGDKSVSFINNRARLSMGYKRSNLELKFSGQHVGVWGQSA